jgi:crotonobetainyl-CoA hydratase
MTVRTEQRLGVLLVTIDRPEARNAINGAVAAGIEAALDRAEDDDSIRVVVITGSGDKAFSAGADLKAVASSPDGSAIMTERGGFAGLVRRSFPKVLIAAVNGAALGGGLEIALACDLVVAADHATFGIPEVKRGLFAGAGGLLRLPRVVALPVALELGVTGDSIDAERAYALGLVNRVVPADRLLDEAFELADRVAENGPVAVRETKRLMRAAASLDEAEGWRRNDEVAATIAGSGEALEGIVAFAEKRRPNWAAVQPDH